MAAFCARTGRKAEQPSALNCLRLNLMPPLQLPPAAAPAHLIDETRVALFPSCKSCSMRSGLHLQSPIKEISRSFVDANPTLPH